MNKKWDIKSSGALISIPVYNLVVKHIRYNVDIYYARSPVSVYFETVGNFQMNFEQLQQ